MDQLTIEQLDGLLDLLKDQGVEEFDGMGIHVKFRSDAAPVSDAGYEERPRKIPSRSNWEDPSLWPGGTPPKFHTKEK